MNRKPIYNLITRHLDVFLTILLSIILGGMLSLMFTSCSPLQRLERLERRHPQLFNRENDTIRYPDTLRVIVPALKMDTIISVTQARKDTVYITKNGIHSKVYITKDDLYIQSKTEPDTIVVIRTLKIPYQKIVTYRKPRDNLRTFAPYAIIAVLLFLVWYTNRDRRKIEEENNKNNNKPA